MSRYVMKLGEICCVLSVTVLYLAISSAAAVNAVYLVSASHCIKQYMHIVSS